MKDTQGWMLRETWKAKGKPDCLHPELSQERSFAGMITGAYICTTCGCLIEVSQSENDKTGGMPSSAR